MQDEPGGLTAAQTPPSTEDHSRPAPQPDRSQSRRGAFTQDYSLDPTPQSVRDLQPGRGVHQLSGQPPPQGHLGHLKPDPRGSAVEGEADAASPSSVTPQRMQMDPRLAHPGSSSMLFPDLPAQDMQSGSCSSPSLPGGFGPPWSVQTSSPPPPAAPSINAINQMPSAEPESSFYPGPPASSVPPAFFQSFPPLSGANPCAGVNVHGFSGQFSPQMNVPQSRRSPLSPQVPPQQVHPQHGAFLQQRNNYNQQQVRGGGS